MRYSELITEDSGYFFVLVKGWHARVVHEDDMTDGHPTIWVMEKQGWQVVWDSARSVADGMRFAAQWHQAHPEPGPKAAAKLTDTPAFRAWFGASKVVDMHGRPLRVYHGTIRDVAAFKYIKPMGIGAAGWGFNRIGFWFDTHPHTPNYFGQSGGNAGGGNVMPVYLSIQKPLVLENDPVSPQALETLRRLRDASAAAEAAHRASGYSQYGGTEERQNKARREFEAAARQLQNNDREPFQQLMKLLPVFDRKADPGDRKNHTDAVAKVQQGLIARGYDGILLRNTLADSGSRDYNLTDWWIAFRPAQIKSAIGNRGTWSPDDDRVTEARAQS